jgi:hypothetical protein
MGHTSRQSQINQKDIGQVLQVLYNGIYGSYKATLKKIGTEVSREVSENYMKRLILTSLLAVLTASGALAQQFIVTIPGGHDREWYEGHGYRWHDGQWYRGEERERHEYHEHHHHNGYWKDGHYYRYEDQDRD